MDRRDALKALAAIVGSTGMTVTPVTTQEAQGVEIVLLKCHGPITDSTAMRLKAYWQQAVQGTSLADTRTLVFGDDIEVELVRTKPQR